MENSGRDLSFAMTFIFLFVYVCAAHCLCCAGTSRYIFTGIILQLKRFPGPLRFYFSDTPWVIARCLALRCGSITVMSHLNDERQLI